MRAIAYIAEPGGDEYKYLDLKRYLHDLVLTWGFDVSLCVDKSETPYVTPGTGTEVYASWPDLIEAYPNASYVELDPDGDVNLDDYTEPEGDVVYVLGGDYGATNNFTGDPVARVKLSTALPPGRGTWSCLAMAVLAHKVFNA